jgi:hypothetical protein
LPKVQNNSKSLPRDLMTALQVPDRLMRAPAIPEMEDPGPLCAARRQASEQHWTHAAAAVLTLRDRLLQGPRRLAR